MSLRVLCVLMAALLSVVFLAACGDGENTTTSTGEERVDPPAAGFRDTSGVTDIPAFGIEASAAQRAAAQPMLSAYLRAAEAEEWKRACGYLSVIFKTQLLLLIAKLKQIEDKSCKEALRLLSRQAFEEGNRYRGRAPIAALRIKQGGAAGEGAGFALFHGTDGKDYWVTMRLEGGEWKVGSVTPQKLQ